MSLDTRRAEAVVPCQLAGTSVLPTHEASDLLRRIGKIHVVHVEDFRGPIAQVGR
jgi:hypothetical protein